MDGNEIANAFNQQNDKKIWKARCLNRLRKDGLSDVVHFESKGGMVALEYQVEPARFAVKFNKFQGAWGDYIKAISRSLYTVLNTLKSAGMPFEAPQSLAGMVIEATSTDDNTVYVAWKPDHARAATMPELRYSGTLQQMQTQMRNAAPEAQAMHDSAIAAGAQWDGMDGYDFTQPLNPDNPRDHSAIVQSDLARVMAGTDDTRNDLQKWADIIMKTPCPICETTLKAAGKCIECGYTGEKALPPIL